MGQARQKRQYCATSAAHSSSPGARAAILWQTRPESRVPRWMPTRLCRRKAISPVPAAMREGEFDQRTRAIDDRERHAAAIEVEGGFTSGKRTRSQSECCPAQDVPGLQFISSNAIDSISVGDFQSFCLGRLAPLML